MRKITPGGGDTRIVGTDTSRKRTVYASEITKTTLKTTILLAVLSHLKILYQLKYLNLKKILKTTLLRISKSVRGRKRNWIPEQKLTN